MGVFRLSGILILLGVSRIAFGQDANRVSVWYVDWDMYTRSALTAEHIRKRYYTHIEIVDGDEARGFAHELASMPFEPSEKSEHADLRLVIDVMTTDGNIRTYVASKFRIYAPNGESSAKIDERFRSRFRFRGKGAAAE